MPIEEETTDKFTCIEISAVGKQARSCGFQCHGNASKYREVLERNMKSNGQGGSHVYLRFFLRVLIELF